jgi:glycosyltransferase involved in cell wall biosynthesis/GT2 family glycosyltransferase
VIPVFNRKAETLACLGRLEQLKAEAPGLRVVVADDGSTDGTAEAVRAAYPDVALVSGQGDWWWTGGMRAGVAEALRQGTTAILSLNDDTLIQPGSLAALLALAEGHPRRLVSALSMHADGEVIESGYRWAGLKGWTAEHRLPGWEERRRAPYATTAVAGACVLIPAAAFAAVGSYAEALPHYHSNLELCVRCSRAGFEVLVEPKAQLHIQKNLKNADLLAGKLSWQRLRWMFRYPSGGLSSGHRLRVLHADASLGPGGGGLLRPLRPGQEPAAGGAQRPGPRAEPAGMRILFIHNLYRLRGGEDAVVSADMALLREAGHEVELFSVDSREVVEEGPAAKAWRYAQVPWSWQEAARLRAFCAERRFDVAHVHNLSPFLSASVWGALPDALPRVQTLHNYRAFCANGLFLRDGRPCEDCPQGTGLEGILHRCHQGSLASSALLTLARGSARLSGARAKVDLYFCPSQFLLDKHVRYGFDPAQLLVLPNSVADPGLQAASPSRGLYIGRLSEEKGALVLAQALHALPKAAVAVGGEGPLQAELEGKAQLLGWLDAKGMQRAFKAAGFLVCPSTTYENQPLVVLEAMARGLPVLASDSGALRELVQPGRNGFLVPAGDASALADGIRRLGAMSPAQRKRLGAEGRRRYLRKHTPKAHLQALLNGYRRAAQQRRMA